MATTIILDNVTLRETGAVEIRINRSFAIAISAEQARRAINRWLCSQVSMSLLADEPLLFIGDEVTWKVPILLTAGHLGAVGKVGSVDVNIQNGTLYVDRTIQQALTAKAVELARRFADAPAVRDAPAEYVVTMQPTRNAAPQRDAISHALVMETASS